MSNPSKLMTTGAILAAFILILLLLFALQFAQSESRFVYWNIISASNGKYKIEIHSTKRENIGAPPKPSLLSTGHVELKESELHFQIHFKESRDSCKVGINEWSSKWFELPWMKDGAQSPLEAVPAEIRRNDESISAQFTKDPTNLVLLRKRIDDHEYILIAILTRE